MFKSKERILTVVSALAICIGISAHTVYAGGMPDSMPKEKISPLDEALMDIQRIGTKENAPVSLAPKEKSVEPIKATKPKPVIKETTPIKIKKQEPKKKAVPDNRIVQVQPNSSFFGLSVGLYDGFSHDKAAMAFNLEYQPGVKIAGVLQPIFGAMITNQGTIFGYGGVGVPLDITDKVFVMPSVAVGSYHEGDGYDLGQSLAYRIGGELGWKLENQSRISLNAHIITNGDSFDKEDRTEVISLTYTTPLQKFSKTGRNKTDKRPY